MHGGILPEHLATSGNGLNAQDVLLTTNTHPASDVLNNNMNNSKIIDATNNNITAYGPALYHQPHLADGGVDLHTPIY
jgi:hypothetical protein